MSPFPGIDPYIEAQGHWGDFQPAFLTFCRGLLNTGLPESYVAKLEQMVHLVRRST